MKTQIIGLCAAALFAGSAAAQAAATLTVEFDAGSKEGQIMLALFDSESAYDRGGAPVRAVRAGPGEPVRIEGLPAGRYGIKAFHDLNGDGRLNTNPFGVPTEPFAFSNNATGNMGPAKWSDAGFEVGPAGASQRLVFK